MKDHAFCFSADLWQRDGIALWNSEQGLDLSKAPLCDEARSQLSQIFSGEIPWFEGLDETARLEALRSHSCAEILSDFGNCHEEVERFFKYSTSPSSGMPFALHPALDAALVGYPPIGALATGIPGPWPGLTRAGRQFFNCTSPTVYRFPDGNATIARALLAWLRPDVFNSNNAVDRIGETIDVERLRDPSAKRRLNLNESVRTVKPVDGKNVIVETTKADGQVGCYKSSAAIVATWASATPSIVPSLSCAQKTSALAMGRFPVITATLSVSNWKAWKKLGASSLSWPGHPQWQRAELGFPVTFGIYAPPDSPDEPNTITAIGATTTLHRQPSEAAAIGRDFLDEPNRKEWLSNEIIRLLTCALAPYGFDSRFDLKSCEVELWPNGYSRYSTSLDDRDSTVASVADKQALAQGVGPIAIAGADVSDHPFLDGALEAAFDAVSTLLDRGKSLKSERFS